MSIIDQAGLVTLQMFDNQGQLWIYNGPHRPHHILNYLRINGMGKTPYIVLRCLRRW